LILPTNFTVTATNASGAPLNTTPVNITVKPAPGMYYTNPSNGGTVLSLKADQSVTVRDDTLIMHTDGNLVLYRAGAPLWATSWLYSNGLPAGSFNPGGNCSECRAIFQTDGNLVLYDAGNRPYWASMTSDSNATLSITENAPYLSIAG